jgi:hypothetical protein
MSKKIVVGVLRRQVSDAEKQELEKHFPGCELEFHRLDSCDYHEHAKNCRELKPDLVLLPLERPIPSVAMEEGFRHVALIPGQGLKELKPLHPDFKDFNSKQITCEHTNRERTGAWSGWTRCTDCDLSIAPPKPENISMSVDEKSVLKDGAGSPIPLGVPEEVFNLTLAENDTTPAVNDCKHPNAKWGNNAWAGFGACDDCKKTLSIDEDNKVEVTGDLNPAFTDSEEG